MGVQNGQRVGRLLGERLVYLESHSYRFVC